VPEALIGLGGVVLGASATAGITWWVQRDNRREKRRIAARLMLGEASAFRAQLREARQAHHVLSDAGVRARRLLDAWRERPAELSALPIETWHMVTMGVHGLYMLAQDADFVAGEDWNSRTDRVYKELEEMLKLVEGAIRALAEDSRSWRRPAK
jgi:hypothetical protein